MTEQQSYTVVDEHPGFEVRRYADHVVAEVRVEGSAEDATNRAFRILVAYIGGRNHGTRSVAMTAPVVQRQDGEPGAHLVSFVMPAAETLESLPVPDDARVTLRAVPEELGAALRYSGRWTETGYRQRLAQLEQALSDAGVRAAGTPR